MNRVILAGILAVLLSGCAVIQAQQAREAEVTGQACAVNVYNSPANALLRAHVPQDFNFDNATLAQMSDQNLPTSEEVQAINAVFPAVVSCRNEYVSRVQQIVPAAATILQNNYYKQDNDVVALVQRRMSWGEFVQRTRANSAERRAEIAVLGQQLQQQRAIQAQQSMQLLGIAAQMMEAGRPTPLGTAVPISRPVTCSQTGSRNSINPSITCY